MITTYSDTYAYVARPILSSYPLPGFAVPVVTIEEDPHEELLDELDSLISDDAAERRVTIVSERLALVRHALERTGES